MKLLKQLIALAYTVILCWLVFFEGNRNHINHHPLNWVPVRRRVREFRELWWHDGENAFNFYANLIGNVLLFMPIPIILSWFYPRLSERKTALICLFTSISIEILQYVFQRGVCDIDDVLLNFSGGLVGIALVRVIRKPGFREQLLHL